MKLYAVALAALVPSLAVTPVNLEKAKALGTPSAPVRIELYSDYQCPACKGFHDSLLPVLVKDYVLSGKVYFVSREFPLPGHPYSREAANYATAAAQIGKYKQVVAAIFRSQASWSTSGKVWDAVATALTPAEQKKVQELAADPSITAAVQQELQMGQANRVNQTPTLVIIRGQKRYPFAGPDPSNYPIMRSLIDGLLK
jgi:protein-disulfide isomerase